MGSVVMAKRGRPKGTKKEPKINYHRRVLPEWVKAMDDKLNELKEAHKEYKKVFTNKNF